MKKIKQLLFLAVATVGLATMTAAAQAQQKFPLKRTDLQRNDQNIPGHEIVQVRIDFPEKSVAPGHSHPGEETIYVLKGVLEYQMEGKPPVTLKAGEVLFVPAGVVHSAKNVGKGEAQELATYTVEKGKPLVTLAR